MSLRYQEILCLKEAGFIHSIRQYPACISKHHVISHIELDLVLGTSEIIMLLRQFIEENVSFSSVLDL